MYLINRKVGTLQSVCYNKLEPNNLDANFDVALAGQQSMCCYHMSNHIANIISIRTEGAEAKLS